ncbi:MAG TPA: TPM domain-containing protein [Caulobacteraceae bacterium]|jgi:putative membrane protein
MRLTEEGRERIAAAVAEAEARTTGEIVCVLARRVSSYPEVPIGWAAAAALLLPPLLVALGVQPLFVSRLLGEWVIGHAAAIERIVGLAIGGYALLQGAIFMAVALLVSIPEVRRLLTPRPLKARRVHAAARQQYLATGLHLSGARTGVVIFASFDDHWVEVVADPLIHGRCGEAVWARAVEAVRSGMKRRDAAGGFVEAVGVCADALAQHFPDDGGENRLSDRPLEV